MDRERPGRGTDTQSVDTTSETPPEPEEEAESSQGTSVFIPADVLGGKTYREGDTITLTVKTVDGDSGEIEAIPQITKQTSSKMPYEAAMDESIPED